MKTVRSFSRFFPLYFFIFFAIFLTTKFTFIFFFRASYEPRFLFELTPFYMLSGFNNLQLLFLSFIVVLADAYFHINASKRNLMYSFFPTAIMLCGLGLSITTMELSAANLLHYVLFGCLLAVLLIDHRHTLVFPEELAQPKKEPFWTKIAQRTPVSTKPQVSRIRPRLSFSQMSASFSLFKREKKMIRSRMKEVKVISSSTQPPVIAPTREQKPIEQRRSSPPYSRISQSRLRELDIKMKKLEQLDKEIEQRRKLLVKREKQLRERFTPSYKSIRSTRTMDAMISDTSRRQDAREHPLIIDEIQECAAIVQRGMFKQINDSFAQLLGYEMDELIEKSLLDLVVPEGLAEIGRYYLNRLKGKDSSTYEVVFVTKYDREVAIKVTIRPTTFNGEKAEIAIFKKLEHQIKEEK
jgi:PAS domain S-box-containing protein